MKFILDNPEIGIYNVPIGGWMTTPNQKQIEEFIKKAGISKAEFIAMQSFSEKLTQERQKRENKQ